VSRARLPITFDRQFPIGLTHGTLFVELSVQIGGSGVGGQGLRFLCPAIAVSRRPAELSRLELYDLYSLVRKMTTGGLRFMLRFVAPLRFELRFVAPLQFASPYEHA
jgi:hypothetical protein